MESTAASELSRVMHNHLVWVIACSPARRHRHPVDDLHVRRASQCSGRRAHRAEVNKAFRVGAISAIGPSLAVVLIAVAMLPLFGAPTVLVRIRLIGSARTELAPAVAVAVASIFSVISVMEPISYLPVLGQAGMYQAFMIGNISNKLLPSPPPSWSCSSSFCSSVLSARSRSLRRCY